MNQLRPFLILVLLAPLIFVNDSVHAQSAVEIPPVLVDSLRLEMEKIQPKLQLPAVVEPAIQGRLTTEIKGLITRIAKNLGDEVKKGQPVLFVKNSQIGYEFKEYGVTAPVSGLVTELPVTVGAYVQPGDPLGHVINPKSMRLVAEVPAVNLPDIQNGQEATFKLGSLLVEAKVSGIGRQVKPTTGTARVELTPESDTSKLVSGSVGELTIRMDEVEAIAVPLRAVLDIGNDSFVRKIVGDRIRLQEVTLGRIVGQERIVLDGLEDGDEIVVQATDHLKEGDPIKRSPASEEGQSGR